MWSGGPVRWGYLRPDQFLDHLTVIKRVYVSFKSLESLTSIALSTIDINDFSYNDSRQLEWVGVVSMVKWLG